MSFQFNMYYDIECLRMFIVLYNINKLSFNVGSEYFTIIMYI